MEYKTIIFAWRVFVNIIDFNSINVMNDDLFQSFNRSTFDQLHQYFRFKDSL